MHIKKYLLAVLFLQIFFIDKLSCFLRDFIESVKIVHVNSLKQQIIDFKKVILEENVEVVVDEKMHLWADKVEIDKEKQLLIAEKRENGCVVIEDEDFLILADKFFLNLDKKTGYAKNIRIHVTEGYIKAGRAEKKKDKYWKLKDILFTPCDAPTPHWSIVAHSAKLYNNYLVKVSGVLFKAGDLPFFVLPRMIIPIQNRSKSGFLVPRFAYDDDLGVGIKEEFYWLIGSRCDNTFGVDWREKKGLGFLDEFRWVRSPEAFTLANARFVIEKNAFVQKRKRIIKETDQRYWIEGKDFRPLGKPVGDFDVYSLAKVDFGTDKQFGYQFFDKIQTVDDTFYNSLTLRNFGRDYLTNFVCDWSKTIRKQFFSGQSQTRNNYYLYNNYFDEVDNGKKVFKDTEKKEDVTVCKLPHLELNSIYKNLKNVLFFRQDVFADRIFSRESSTEKIYLNSRLVDERVLMPLKKADTFRFYYQADLGTSLKFKDQIVNFYLSPNFQLRSNLKYPYYNAKQNVLEGRLFDHGAYRLFFQGGAEWCFPEAFLENEKYDYFYYFQPILKWNFLPKFYQNAWFYSNQFDRAYPKNEVGIYLRNSWDISGMDIDLNIGQFYDFYNRSDIYPMRRCPQQKNLLPFQIELGVGCDILSLLVAQEYNLKGVELLQNEITLNFCVDRFHLSLSTLYQDAKLRHTRELLSTVPHSILFGISVPLSKNATLSYNGQFYSEKNSTLFPFEGLKPLLHRVSLDYEGHCWGIALGFEEKRYRETGIWKSERAFTLYVKLESLGSFARKFKRPTMVYSKE